MVVRVTSDEEFRAWYLAWSGEFLWDKGNTGKLSKHKLTTDDVEEFFERNMFYAGRVVSEEAKRWNEDRFMFVVRVEPVGLYFSIFVTPRDETLRVVSCRRARPDEEKRYDQRIEPEDEDGNSDEGA